MTNGAITATARLGERPHVLVAWGALIAGPIGDRIGRRPVLIGCVAVFGLFSLLSAFSGSPLQLASLRFGTGLGLGGGVPLAIALASDHAPPGTQGRLVILLAGEVAARSVAGEGAAWGNTHPVRFANPPWIKSRTSSVPRAGVVDLASAADG